MSNAITHSDTPRLEQRQAYIPVPSRHDLMWRHPQFDAKPPRPGWYPASVCCDPSQLRWWDGRNWSESQHHSGTADEAAISASVTEQSQDIVYWTYPWWPQAEGA